jgi:hypothetical protein
MYKNISLQAYRNLNEYRLDHKIDLSVGMIIALLKSRTDLTTNQTVYSLTTNCEIISINPVHIYGMTNITLKPEGQDSMYLDYSNMRPTITKSDKYEFSTKVLQLPSDIDLTRILYGKLYYIMVINCIYLNGIKKCSKVEVPVFGYDEKDAFEQLTTNTETELSLGDQSYRVVDMNHKELILKHQHYQ